MYKVIVSDLDGTLLNSQHQVSPRTRHILQRLLAAGLRFIVATGRHHIDVRSIRDALGLEIYLVSANGAVVHDKQDRAVYNRVIPAPLAAAVLREPVAADATRNFFTGDAWLVEREMPEFLEFHRDTGFRYQVVDMNAVGTQDINKIFFIGEHEPLFDLERRLLARHGDALSVAFSLPTCLEIMPKGVNKGAAVKAILEQNGFRPEQLVAFGDGMNDLEMLSLAGLGVVMGNAHNRLKEALPANPQALSCDEDGVAEYLAKLFSL
jgi:Cof subfamily protein (haloacid dehalogenase superfamily)